MYSITIKDFYNRVCGWIEVKDNGDKIVKDNHYRVVGKYYAGRNVTTDFYGRVVARGDVSASLITEPKP